MSDELQAYQINPKSKYIFRINEEHVSASMMKMFKQQLKDHGIDALVIHGDIDIFELKQDTPG